MNNHFVLFLILLIFSYIPTCLFGNSLEGKKRIVFIVNPISHEIKGLDIRGIIEKNLDPSQFEYEIVYTQYAQHAIKLTHDALLDSADIIAAVGGDGTVNEVGKALVNTKAVLAIVPVGSGNGLARHLGIPVGLTQAIKALNHAHPIVIDTAKINDKTFLGVAGIGFDAQIAHQFAQFGKRGFFSYCQVALREFLRYEPESYLITIDGKQIIRKAFVLTFANSSQYGNDFIIAPKARISDGYLDLVIIDDIPGYSTPQFIYKFKHGTLDRSHHFETHRFKEITIHHPYMQAHVDGEPMLFQNDIKVTIQPKSLKILVPKKTRSKTDPAADTHLEVVKKRERHTRVEEENMSFSEKEALTKAANHYMAILSKIGADKSEYQSEEIMSLCTKNCKKVRNGKLLFEGREFFAAQLDSGKEWLGIWSIEVCEVLIATDKRSAIIRYELSTEKEGDLVVVVILHFDSNYMIYEINEVHNRLEK